MTFRKFNPRLLPYLAAGAQMLMFSYVGVKYFNAWGWIIGPAVGAVVNLSLAVASSKISDIAKKRQPLARLMYVMLFILSPATIALSIYEPDSVFTAIAWASSPDLAIALAGAIVGQGMVAKDETIHKVSETTRKKKKVARKRVKDIELIAYFRDNEGASDVQAAEHFGISRQAIGQRRRKLFDVRAVVDAGE